MKRVISAVLVLFLSIMSCMGRGEAVAESDGNAISIRRKGDFGYEICIYPDKSKYIDIKCYYGNDSHVIIPDEIDGISVGCVSGLICSKEAGKKVKEITLGVNVRKITAFDSLPELEAIHCCSGNAFLEDIDGVLFGKRFYGITKILCYPRKKKGSSYVIPDYIEEIDSAFEKNEYLRTVNVGKYVKRITDFGKWSKIEQVIFSGQGKLKRVDTQAFQYMTKLRQINIPKGVTCIGERAFQYCGELTDIQLPSSMGKIEDNAFLSCSSLKKIKIPKRVYYIGGNSFLQCRAEVQKASYLRKRKEKKTKINVQVKLGKKWMALKTPVAEFESSDKKIAAVNKDGTVKAKKKGTVEITTKLYHESWYFPFEEVLKYTTTIKVR